MRAWSAWHVALMCVCVCVCVLSVVCVDVYVYVRQWVDARSKGYRLTDSQGFQWASVDRLPQPGASVDRRPRVVVGVGDPTPTTSGVG